MLENGFKIYEKILGGRFLEVVDTDKMQYGFMPGRGTVDGPEPKIRCYFLYFLTWKRLLIGSKESYLFCC